MAQQLQVRHVPVVCCRTPVQMALEKAATCSHLFSPTLGPTQERTAPLSSTSRGLCLSGRVSVVRLAGLLLLALNLSLTAWLIDFLQQRRPPGLQPSVPLLANGNTWTRSTLQFISLFAAGYVCYVP